MFPQFPWVSIKSSFCPSPVELKANDMDRPQWNSLGLCSGVGLLDLAVCLGAEQLGIECKPAVLCEWDAYAASVLLARMEDATLEPCPIWCGDLRDFDAQPFRGVVDVLAAGLPCQPYSVAGKQLGNIDKRSHGDDGSGLIPRFLRIVAECRPSLVFCENVPPWVRDGYFRPVGEELSRMGYKIEDPLFITAESVGASHKRERVFVLAHGPSERWRKDVASAAGRGPDVDERGEGMADAERPRRPAAGSRRALDAGSEPQPGLSDDLADAERSGSRGQRVSRRGSKRRGEVGRAGEAVGNSSGAPTQSLTAGSRSRDSVGQSSLFAHGPGADWGAIPEHLWPATQPGIRVVVDGRPVVVDEGRADQLRCSGNAVVPLCAAVAFVELVRRVIASN